MGIFDWITQSRFDLLLHFELLRNLVWNDFLLYVFIYGLHLIRCHSDPWSPRLWKLGGILRDLLSRSSPNVSLTCDRLCKVDRLKLFALLSRYDLSGVSKMTHRLYGCRSQSFSLLFQLIRHRQDQSKLEGRLWRPSFTEVCEEVWVEVQEAFYHLFLLSCNGSH